MSSEEVLYRLGSVARAALMPFVRVDDDGFVYFNFADPDAKRHMHIIKKLKSKRERRIDGKGEEAKTWEGEWVEVELHDPLKALELIGKQHRLFTERLEIGRTGEGSYKLASLPAELIAPDFLNVYRDIVQHKNTEYIFSGGRGSTKSSFISFIIVYLIKNNPLMHALISRQVANTMRDSVYAQLQWAIGELGLSDEFRCTTSPLEIEYLPTGQKIYFRGFDDPGKIKSLKPTFGYLAIFWAEEADQIKSAESMRKVEQSLRGGDEMYFFKSFNPPRSAQNWLNKYVKVPKVNQYHHTSNYLTVPKEWLGQVFLDEAEHLKNVNPSAYANEYMGEVTGMGGLVFENVVLRKITDDEIFGKDDGYGNKEGGFDRVLHGLDWGFTVDPAHYSRVHFDARQRILYIFGEVRKWKASNDKLFKSITDYGYDPKDLIIADSAEPKSVADFRAYGANCRGAEKGKDSVRYSMKWLENLTSIVIDPERCPYAAEEFSGYEYEQNSEGEFISEYPDRMNHAIDSVRYSTNMIWRQRGQ